MTNNNKIISLATRQQQRQNNLAIQYISNYKPKDKTQREHKMFKHRQTRQNTIVEQQRNTKAHNKSFSLSVKKNLIKTIQDKI